MSHSNACAVAVPSKTVLLKRVLARSATARPRALKFYSAGAGPKAQVNCRRTLQIVLLGLLGKPVTPVSRWFARALLGLALAILAYWVL